MSQLASCLAGFVITVLMLGLLRPVANRIELTDRPTKRKTHAGNVPLIGGLAMFCGFVFAALTLDTGLTPYRSFFAAGAIMVIVGVLDDMHELSSRARFGAQITAALLMVSWGGVVLTDFGSLRLDGTVFELHRLDVLVTVFCTVGVINALNMSDGADGLAGSLALVTLSGLALLAGGAQRQLLLLLCVVVIAFLLFNLRLPGRPRALVFMGDAGSMFLGFAITWFVIDMSQGEARAITPVTALWLLLVPLFDTVWLIFRRAGTGRWPTSPDAEHLHHVLQMTGLGVNQSVGCIFAVAAMAGLIGIGGLYLEVPERWMFYGFLTLFALYCATMVVAWQRKRFIVWPMDQRLAGEDRRALSARRISDRRQFDERRRASDRRDARNDEASGIASTPDD